MSTGDVIDRLVGIAPGSRLDGIRAQRVQARDNAQKSYLALFAPAMPGNFALAERFAVATFVAGLHRRPAIETFYGAELARHTSEEVASAIVTEVRAGETEGPYGAYPAGPLSVEDRPGLHYTVANGHRSILGARLVAALEHAHLLVFRPRDASPAALQALIDAGLSTNNIVTLSQLVAFLSFQIRVVEGLTVLAGAEAGGNADSVALAPTETAR